MADGEEPPPEEGAPEEKSAEKPPNLFNVCLLTDGTGSIFYPSGRVAVTVTGGTVGRHSVFMNDDRKSTIVASFDPEGVGAVNYKSGAPWVVVNKKGYSVSDERGTFVEQCWWPRPTDRNQIICDLNKYFRFTFKNRQEMTITFQGDAEPVTFDVGAVCQRADNYLEKVSGKRHGKCDLDVASVRGEPFFATDKSIHIYHPLLERVAAADEKLTFATLDANLDKVTDPDLHALVAGLSNTQSRLNSTDTLPVPVYGTSRTAGKDSPTSTMKAGELPPLDLTRHQKKMLASLYKINPNSPPVNYKMKRKRLKQVKVKDVDSFLLTSPKETLMVLCCMGSWNPLCQWKLTPLLEEVNHDLYEKTRKAYEEAHPKAQYPDPSTMPVMPDPSQQLVKIDLGESKLLNERYRFRTVPMMLCFYENELVYATNTMWDKEAIQKHIDQAMTAATRGQFLPKDFKFAPGQDTESAILHCAM